MDKNWTVRVANLADQAGPFLLGALACTGVFARGLANTAYGLLVLWGLFILVRRPWRRETGAPPGPPEFAFRPPALFTAALALFTLTWLASTYAGGYYAEGLNYLGRRLYHLALPFLAWLVFHRSPRTMPRLKFLWGFGLMAAAALTFQEGGFRLICLRAKAHLGIIDLGSVLGLLIPVMLGALLQSLLAGRKMAGAFFALALAAAGLALIQNCSRQTYLAVPLLALLMLWAYRRPLHRHRRKFMIAALLVVLAAGTAFLTTGGARRFTGMVENSNAHGLSLNKGDQGRLAVWGLGWAAFRANPLLGVGPGALPLVNGNQGPGRAGDITNHAHQTFIHTLAETGLAGFLGFLALHLAPLVLIWPHRWSTDPETFFWVWAALAVNLQFVLNSLTDHIFGLRLFMYIQWLVTAAAIWQTCGPGQAKER